MFNKTRRKIVVTVALSLLALMAVTLTVIYFSNRLSLYRESIDMLHTFSDRFFEEGKVGPEGDRPEDAPELKPEDRPGQTPGGDKNPPRERDGGMGRDEFAFRLSTFYSVEYSESGAAVNSGNGVLHDEESLKATADRILASGRTEGRTEGMIYLVTEREGRTLVAMIDGTLNERNQSTLFRQMLITGAAATLVIAAISVLLARRIVRPLEENDERQKRFVSDAGHELKTPIAVISANSELLRREKGGSEWLDNIDYENGRMADLVRELLMLSHAGRQDVRSTPVDFSALVSGEKLPFESLAFEKGVSIEASVEEGVNVAGDPNRLRQLVSILLDNALSHGTGKKITVSLKRERHTAVLSVSNEADGFDQSLMDNLFDRFYRGDGSRSGGGHYGLGLSIAKAVAESHGGKISASYKSPVITFTVVIPAVKKS